MGREACREFDPERLKHLHPGQTASIDDPVGGLEGRDFVIRVASPSQADRVEANDATSLAVNEHEGRDVLHHPGMAADHGEATDAAELMNRHGSRDEGPIFDGDMTTKQGIIGKDATVAHAGIMSEMGPSH